MPITKGGEHVEFTHEGRIEAKRRVSAARKPIARRVAKVEDAQEAALGISFGREQKMQYTCGKEGCEEKVRYNKGLAQFCPTHRREYIEKRRETEPNYNRRGPYKKKQAVERKDEAQVTHVFPLSDRRTPILPSQPERNGSMTDHAARFQAIAEILTERERQDVLKAEGRFKYTLADDGLDDMEKVYTILEEITEAGKNVMAQRGNVTDGETDHAALRKEIVQVAALSLAWLEVL